MTPRAVQWKVLQSVVAAWTVLAATSLASGATHAAPPEGYTLHNPYQLCRLIPDAFEYTGELDRTFARDEALWILGRENRCTERLKLRDFRVGWVSVAVKMDPDAFTASGPDAEPMEVPSEEQARAIFRAELEALESLVDEDDPTFVVDRTYRLGDEAYIVRNIREDDGSGIRSDVQFSARRGPFLYEGHVPVELEDRMRATMEQLDKSIEAFSPATVAWCLGGVGAETDEPTGVNGKVTDGYGRALAHVRVELSGAVFAITQTDEDGNYRFRPPDDAEPAGRDTQVRLILQENRPGWDPIELRPDGRFGAPGRFQIDYQRRSEETTGADRSQVATILSDPFRFEDLDQDCGIDFQAATIHGGRYVAAKPPSLGEWPIAAQLYVDTALAFDVAERLTGRAIDFDLPLDVVAWCTQATLDGCGIVLADREIPVPFTELPSEGRCWPLTYSARNLPEGKRGIVQPIDPHIGLPVPHTKARDRNTQTLYHEFGHYLLATLAGERKPALKCPGTAKPLLRKIDEENHGGYWINGGTADSFHEAFGHFFAYLVMREDGHPSPSSYRGAIGLAKELEAEIKAWDETGAPGRTKSEEEFAVASVLVDMIDDANEYPVGRAVPAGVWTTPHRRESPDQNPLDEDLTRMEIRDLRPAIVGTITNDTNLPTGPGREYTLKARVQFRLGGMFDHEIHARLGSGESETITLRPGEKVRFWAPIYEDDSLTEQQELRRIEALDGLIRSVEKGGGVPYRVLATTDEPESHDTFTFAARELLDALSTDYRPEPKGARQYPLENTCTTEQVRLDRALDVDTYPVVLDVSEMYDALRRLVEAKGGSVEDLNLLFDGAGLFADDGGGLVRKAVAGPDGVAYAHMDKNREKAGNMRRDACEEYGLTSHPDPVPRGPRWGDAYPRY